MGAAMTWAEWGPDQVERLRTLWAGPLTALEIAREFGDRSRNSIIGKAHKLGLPARDRRGPAPRAPRDAEHKRVGHVRKAFKSKGDDVTFSRWVKTGAERAPPRPRQIALPTLGNASIEAGRSLFHRRGVVSPRDHPNVLVSGHNNVKIGRDVRKGPLRGYWIYALSLEERATCPASCFHYATCYGNNMPYARRVDHRDDQALRQAIATDLARLLAVKNRVGILVRLHALGDFYSVDYVNFWIGALHAHPRLAVYGYTAWSPDSHIGRAIAAGRARHGDRFAIRWSNGGLEQDCTQPIRSVDEAVNSIVCPEQTGKTKGCGTCALCWTTRRNIAFLEH